MGRPVAANLLRAGLDLMVHARSPERASALLADGAVWAEDERELSSQVDVVITMLPDSGAGRRSQTGARPGVVWVDMSTIDPGVSRSLSASARGIELGMLDAPVSGGEIAAANASLSTMLGGDVSVLGAVSLVLELLDSVTHVGPAGAGEIGKPVTRSPSA
jgi:3-hydroxyisobutyrate dehydrogenase-like beta-hydroxyacid dehydrogenase